MNESYLSSYDNLSSAESLNFTTDFKRNMGSFLSTRLSEFKRVEVTRLSNGSVVVEFYIVVGKSSTESTSDIVTVLKESNSTSLGYTLIGDVIVEEVQESSTAVVPTRTSETGRAAFLSEFTCS